MNAALALTLLAGLGMLLYRSMSETASGSVSYGVSPDANVSAFLALIRAAESNDDYSALVGGGNFTDFSDHPALTGEWGGIRREDDGRLTTAAGAYQITRTTWKDLGGASVYGDFSPAAQDAAAVALVTRRGALGLIQAGRLQEAMARLAPEWEAFQRILAGTYPLTFSDAQSVYTGNGGQLA